MGVSDSISKLRFISTASLERGLDGSDEAFAAYFFAIYHCSPDEPAGISKYREQLREAFPDNATRVGRYFVLDGQAAFLALSAYYTAMGNADTLSDELREYMRECVEMVTTKHRRSQSLPVPVNLFEGQLSHDPRLEFFVGMALDNRQIITPKGA